MMLIQAFYIQNISVRDLDLIFFCNPLFVTICPETFSNLCVDSARGM